jgi:hypothetical protein
VPANLTKDEIIRRYEIGLSTGLWHAGLRSHALYDPDRYGLLSRSETFNASHFLWKELICEMGMPFIKIDLLRDNPLFVTDVEEWRDVVAAHRPSLLAAIADDLTCRRTIGRKQGGPSGVRRKLLIFYLRLFRRCVQRDFQYAWGRRPALLRLNAFYSRLALSAYRSTIKLVKILIRTTGMGQITGTT